MSHHFSMSLFPPKEKENDRKLIASSQKQINHETYQEICADSN